MIDQTGELWFKIFLFTYEYENFLYKSLQESRIQISESFVQIVCDICLS